MPEPRLPEPYGLWVDRTQTVTFTFEGHPILVCEGTP